jgi:hypothetical protein
VEEVYEFDDEKVTLTQTKGNGLNSTSHMEYLYFYKIVETPTHFLLYLSSDQCHIVPKKDIVEGTVQDLRTIFTTHAPTKFKK